MVGLQVRYIYPLMALTWPTAAVPGKTQLTSLISPSCRGAILSSAQHPQEGRAKVDQKVHACSDAARITAQGRGGGCAC